MNIEEIEKLADSMVEVCVGKFNADRVLSPKGGQDYLLWEYMRLVLIDAVNSTVDTVVSRQQDLQRELRGLTSQGMDKDIAALVSRRDDLKEQTQ